MSAPLRSSSPDIRNSVGPAPVLDDLDRRLREELDFPLAGVSEMDPGVVHNNRLLHLQAVDGRELVAKVYFPDDRRRLEREFGAVSFLIFRSLCRGV